MAKQQAQPGSNGQAPYPTNWGKMTAGQKRTWMAANRPAQNAGAPTVAPARPPAAPPQQPKAAPFVEQPQEEQPQEEQPQEYTQEQPGEEGTITINLSQSELAGLDGAKLVARLLRTVADALCPPDVPQ